MSEYFFLLFLTPSRTGQATLRVSRESRESADLEAATHSHHLHLRFISRLHQLPSESPRFRPRRAHCEEKCNQFLHPLQQLTQSEPETLINPITERRTAKMVHKVCIFRGLRKNRENPADLLKVFDWAYHLDYKQEEPIEADAKKEFQD